MVHISDHSGWSGGVQPPLTLPEEGLCPALRSFIFGESSFTPSSIIHFITSRLSLSQDPNTTFKFARPERFYAVLSETRPDFVARDKRGRTNSAEEVLWGLGLDAKIRMQDLLFRVPVKYIVRDRGVGDDEDEEKAAVECTVYDPRKGVPRWYGGDAEQWTKSYY
ncbi:hypothetical protein NMY22_g7510 [Coprinellus aureogranulatus]|nr:hypothetical protein NMY22_g7510 [Coprinellus aureogranulatus]